MIYLHIIKCLHHANSADNNNLEFELSDDVTQQTIDNILNSSTYLDYFLTYNSDNREFKTIKKMRCFYNDDFNNNINNIDNN